MSAEEDWADGSHGPDGIALVRGVEHPGGPSFGIDVESLAGQLVDKAVQAAVAKEVTAAAELAVKELMTPEILEAIRIRADESAQAAVMAQVDGTRDEPIEDPGTEEAAEQDPTPELMFGSTDEFVREYLSKVYRRPINGRENLWAAQWWDNDEAQARLEALWRAWEHLRLDAATGMSVWWRDHADHHMAVLLSPEGPFHAVDYDEKNRSRRGAPLPYEAPPAGMFPDVRLANQDGS